MPVLAKPQVSKSTVLLDQLREQIRYLHYSLRTEEAYVYWVKNLIRFHGLKHSRDIGQVDIESFLTYLATQRKVSVSTHLQALRALFFYIKKATDTGKPSSTSRFCTTAGFTERRPSTAAGPTIAPAWPSPPATR
ncbi:MAG TPA: phage integrase N-terminal SAM-like domain-containing protein [Rhodoferax sp.]